MTGSVLEIWTAPAAAAPMVRRPAVVALPGAGLAGDRYARGGGTWAQYPAQEKQVTLIDADDVAEVARLAGVELSPGQTRRNVVTRGIDLNALVGRRFRIGDVECFAQRLCEPCAHLERLRPGTLRPLVHRGGLRADILAGGVIRVGDPVGAG
jgi:MOSC domain-containing protein YiiM